MSVERSFIPGSRWLYFKIYTGPKSADEILVSYLYPLAGGLMRQKNVTDFFFIRYSDPKFHLRVRFRIDDPKQYGAVFNAFYETFQPALQNDLVSLVQCDTYQRELERYGTVSMETSERIFGRDSQAILALLHEVLSGNAGNPESVRWQLSFPLIDGLLEAFEMDPDQKIAILSRLSESYKNEFGFTRNTFTKQLNDKYRAHRKQIAESFECPEGIRDILSARQAGIHEQARELLEMEKQQVLEVAIPDLICSLTHMTMNRWFRSKNRQYELVIYDFLLRQYKSQQAIKNNKAAKAEPV